MANGRSCCCSGLSKGWWWLLTLLGLSLLYFLMFSAKRGIIEEDIQTRTTQQLAVENANWAGVDVNYRGRDVLLTGVASTDVVRDAAIKTALSVEGVRVVESNIDIVPLKQRALTAHYSHQDGKLVVEGVLSSQAEIDEIGNLLVARVGADNVNNKLTISDQYGKDGGRIELSGSVLNDGARSDILSAVKTGSDALGLTLTDNLSIDTAAIETKRLAAEKAEVDKLAAEKADADKLAAEKADADKLAAEKAEADKLAAEKADADKLAAEKAEADKLVVEKADADKLAAEKADADKLAAEKADADKLAAEKADAEKADADKLAAEKAAADKLAVENVNSCQTKLNNMMSGKTILFNTNKADIKNSSFSLLKTIANVIKECQSTLPNAKIAVSGHTDSQGSDEYNLLLSEDRATAVKKHLTSIGVSKEIITSKGYGESQPVVSNDTAEGRTKNRRITFSVR